MNPGLSSYLDLLRVAAAMLVFLSHLSWTKLSGGALWQLQPLGHDGVIVFFVLSGYVIQHVVTHKENRLFDYSLARLARLYSVVIPALILTLLCDAIGQALDPAIYPPENETTPLLRLGAAAIFLTQNWGWNLALLSNSAFWSLPYEFWYYLIFGAAVFARGRWRVAWIALFCLAVGPAILIYFPIWLGGALACHLGERQKPGQAVARLIFFASLAVLAAIFAMEFAGRIERVNVWYLPPTFAWIDFVTGTAVMLNLYAAGFVDLPLRRAAPLIRYLAGFSFALYLFHLPLLCLAAAMLPAGLSVAWRAVSIGTFTLVCVFGLGFLSEHRKSEWAKAIRWVFDKARAAR